MGKSATGAAFGALLGWDGRAMAIYAVLCWCNIWQIINQRLILRVVSP